MRGKMFIVLLILFIGFLLKIHTYSQNPQRGATSDEYTYAFLGLSLLNTGVPTSWSYFSSYVNRYDLMIENTRFPMVTPYFDHPPLFGLVVGLWSKLNNENTFASVKLSTIRIVPIILSSVTALFVYLVSKKLYGNDIALLALAIYSSATIFVVHSRVVLAENLLTMFFLVAIYIFETSKRKFTGTYAMVLGSLAGASFWAKETGVVVFFTILIFLLLNRIKRNLIAIYCFTFFLWLLGYVLYGFIYGQELFWKIVSIQSIRDIGPRSLWYLLSTPVLVNKVFYDGWYFFGLISLFSLLREKRYIAITVPFFCYLLILISSLTQEGQSGWYLIPLFPFMAISSASTIVESLKQRSWFFVIFLFIIGEFLIEQLFVPFFGLAPNQFRILTTIMLFPIVFLILNKKDTFDFVAKWWTGFLLIGTMLVTFLYRHPV